MRPTQRTEAEKSRTDRLRDIPDSGQMIIFSDLDGTLLDHRTYSFEPAQPALEAIQAAGIPLVLCTSKTRAETERWRRELGNVHPFVVENGGAAFIPRGYFPSESDLGKVVEDYSVLEFGRSYSELRQALAKIRSKTRLPVRGFGDMTVGEIAHLCSFRREDAVLAADRAYDEPLFTADAATLARVAREAESMGLTIVRGGRFAHLVGGCDKGRAVLVLRSLYAQSMGPVLSVGIGDGENDEPMLRSVDVPVIVRKPDGRHLEIGAMPKPIISLFSGPAGWREAVLGLLGERT